MAAGRPVICLNIGGPAAQVTDETGFRIEPTSPEEAVAEMARVMLLLANSPELVARMGAAGRAHVKRHYSLSGTIRAMVDLYLSSIQSTGSQRRSIHANV
jgi:glycosyltransferase involved in cell wall biosynthesis